MESVYNKGLVEEFKKIIGLLLTKDDPANNIKILCNFGQYHAKKIGHVTNLYGTIVEDVSKDELPSLDEDEPMVKKYAEQEDDKTNLDAAVIGTRRDEDESIFEDYGEDAGLGDDGLGDDEEPIVVQYINYRRSKIVEQEIKANHKVLLEQYENVEEPIVIISGGEENNSVRPNIKGSFAKNKLIKIEQDFRERNHLPEKKNNFCN